jgi:hypothetical protein
MNEAAIVPSLPFLRFPCRAMLTGIILAGLAVASRIVAQPAWAPVQCIPADPTPDRLFDVEAPFEGFEQGIQGWSAAEGSQMARASVKQDASEHHGVKASLRVDYDFTGKKDYEYILIQGPVLFPQPGKSLGFWINHDGNPFLFRLRVTDKSGECHQFETLCSMAAGWQFVTCSLSSPSSSWGGDGNKQLDYPCKLDGILIDRPERGFIGRGTLWIDDVCLVRKAAPLTNSLKLETLQGRLGNLYAVGDTVSLRASGDGERIRWTAKDYFGVELSRGEGPARSIEMSATLKYPGWFVFKTDLIANGRVTATRLFPCAAVIGGKETARSGFFGVCTHFSGYPLATMRLLQSYGIDQFRDEISWGAYEVQKDRLAMPGYGAAFLKRSKELGMRPLLILCYADRFHDHGDYPNSPEAIEAFGKYSVDVVRQTRGLVDRFEVWNEWVGGCGMEGRNGQHDGEAYGKLLAPTYQAIKAAFPETKVVGIGGEYGAQCAENILGAIRTAGTNSMDAWSIHPLLARGSPTQGAGPRQNGAVRRTIPALSPTPTTHGLPSKPLIMPSCQGQKRGDSLGICANHTINSALSGARH